jgi:hypothetical protein
MSKQWQPLFRALQLFTFNPLAVSTGVRTIHSSAFNRVALPLNIGWLQSSIIDSHPLASQVSELP